jgi:uncharacterized membrane protein
MHRKEKVDNPQDYVNKHRLEFLFDGIFAISMTILVLELKVPELSERKSVTELLQQLLHHGATFFSYLLSFGMLGILWFSHNQYFRFFKRITTATFILNLIQMASAAFFPFCAALLGKYPTNRLTLVVYIGCLTIFQLCSLIQWLLAKKQNSFVPRMDPAVYFKFRKGFIFGSSICAFMFIAYLSIIFIP